MASTGSGEPKPKFLLGCSAAERPVALAVKAGLEDLAETTLWCRGRFEPDAGLAGLVEGSRAFEFAAFVISPDDLSGRRWTRRDGTDQVILPLGIFLGALGRTRTFLVCTTDVVLALPQELRGVVVAAYPPPRSGAPPAIACACTVLRAQILRLVPAAAPAASKTKRGSSRPNQVARRRRRPTLGTAYLAGPRRVLKISDISMTGALLESFGEIPEGQLLDLDLALEDGSRVRVTAKVARNQHPQWGRTGGVGVAFLRFEGDSREHLARYIDSDPAAGEEIHALIEADVPAR